MALWELVEYGRVDALCCGRLVSGTLMRPYVSVVSVVGMKFSPHF